MVLGSMEPPAERVERGWKSDTEKETREMHPERCERGIGASGCAGKEIKKD